MEPSLMEQRKMESKRTALLEASLREDVDLAGPMPKTINVESVDVPEERDGVLKGRISGDSVCCISIFSLTIITLPASHYLGFLPAWDVYCRYPGGKLTDSQ